MLFTAHVSTVQLQVTLDRVRDSLNSSGSDTALLDARNDRNGGHLAMVTGSSPSEAPREVLSNQWTNTVWKHELIGDEPDCFAGFGGEMRDALQVHTCSTQDTRG